MPFITCTVQAVDDRLRQRAAQAPQALSAFLAKAPVQTAEGPEGPDAWYNPPKQVIGLAASLARNHGVSETVQRPYAAATAAAKQVARLQGKGDAVDGTPLRSSAVFTSPQRSTALPEKAAALGTGAAGRAPGSPAGMGGGLMPGAVPRTSLLALPGQLQYRELLTQAQRSRAADASAFQRELEDMDGEIDAYLAAERFERSAPAAALTFQTAWRARGPRLLFNRYREQRQRAGQAALEYYFSPLRQLMGALRHARRRLLRRCFQEWREMDTLKMELYKKVGFLRV